MRTRPVVPLEPLVPHRRFLLGLTLASTFLCGISLWSSWKAHHRSTVVAGSSPAPAPARGASSAPSRGDFPIAP